MVNDSLTILGWFDVGRKHTAITFIDSPVGNQTEIPLNTLALSDEDEIEHDDELGSQLAEHRWQFYIDFYAENNSVGLHLSRDVRDIVAGRFGSIGRNAPIVHVYDYTMATPAAIFTVEIENVVRDRAHDFPKKHLQHWYAVRFEIVDHYATDQDI
jgi:hypothetical protein